MAFDLASAEFRADPYPYYAQMHAHAPVHHWEAWNMWFFSRHEDVSLLLRDPRVGRNPGASSEAPPQQQPLFEMMDRWMLLVNPPDHTRLRSLVQKAFTPRRIAQLRDQIEQIAHGLLDRIPPGAPFDLIETYAYPLPVNVICAMLGVPPEDYVHFHAWSDAVARSLDFTEEAAIYDHAATATIALTGYFGKLLEARRARPQDDLLSALVAAEEEGDRLTQEELFATCVLLLIAGHETTVNLIGNGTLALLRHPDQWELLRRDPALAPTAVEELLRYDSPVQATARTVLTPFEHRGIAFTPGTEVGLMLGAANHDPDVFAEPARLDITRQDNRHLAFGGGIHYCLGAPLARLEGQIAFTTLVRRFPALRLADPAVRYRDNYTLRGLVALQVSGD